MNIGTEVKIIDHTHSRYGYTAVVIGDKSYGKYPVQEPNGNRYLVSDAQVSSDTQGK